MNLKPPSTDDVDMTYTDVIPNHRVSKNTANGSETKQYMIQGSDAEYNKVQGSDAEQNKVQESDTKLDAVVFEDNELYVAGEEPTENMYDLAGNIYDTALPVAQNT